MARIKQVGLGQKSSGTLDGITYVTRNGVTYARSAPNMPAYVYKTPASLKRQAIFKLIQMHLKYHLRTIRKTSIRIASLSGYQEVYLTGAWPTTITLNALGGDSTVIIIVAENGTTTTINPSKV